MDFLAHINPWYAVSGLAVGFLVGLTGVGGGALMTPLLITGFGVPAAIAVGTDLLYTAASRGAAAIVHGMNRNIDWRVVWYLTLGAIPATLAALAMLWRFGPQGEVTKAVITHGLAIAILLAALTMIARKPLARLYGARIAALNRRATAWWTVGIGAVLGALVSLTSVGAAAIGVPLLAILYPNLSAARIVGSQIVQAVPLALVAGMGYLAFGAVDAHLLVALMVGSLPGVIAGSMLAPKTPDGILRHVLAVLMVLAAGKLLI